MLSPTLVPTIAAPHVVSTQRTENQTHASSPTRQVGVDPDPVVRQEAIGLTGGRAIIAASEPVLSPDMPQPMLAPTDNGATPNLRTVAHRAPNEPTRIVISIGRVELRAPAAPAVAQENSATPAPPSPCSAYQPRLTLDDYLAQPNRGRR